jgi:hypothetical protein
MFDLVTATNNVTVLTNNLARSPLLDGQRIKLHVKNGYPSASMAYHDAMRACAHDVVVFAHHDVYLPKGWELKLSENINRLTVLHPEWAVLGVYGVQSDGTHLGCVWSSGLNQVCGARFGAAAAVSSLDEVLIVVRRSSGVDFDTELPGFHLYGTDLVQSALSRRMGAYVIYAPVIHNSTPCPYLNKDYFAAYDFIVRKWKGRLPINNNVAPIVAPGATYWHLRARHKINEWRHVRIDRQRLERRYDCVRQARELGWE